MLKSLPNAPRRGRKGITRHYPRPNGQSIKDDANVRRLRAISRIFGIGPSAIARAGGVSQPYASRVLSETDPFVGNAEFYRRLEGKLGGLIDRRSAQFFRVSPVPIRRIENATELSGL